jgi:murein DD-endopeptidase MepM/ murein hydrolase activator NlpD
MPVRIGGRVHLAYELHITNFRTLDLALTRIDVLGDSSNASPLARYQGDELRAGLTRAGARPDGSDMRIVHGGTRVVFFVWLALGESAAAPSVVHHQISFDVLGATEREAGAVDGGRVDLRRELPLVLDAPLRGGPWVAVYDPSLAGGHRRAIFAIDGKARIPARFAIDWIRLQDDGRVWRGDASNRATAPGYGADVLAVADGVVVAAVDGVPEPTTPITLDNAAGNYVTIDLGDKRFASYEHLQPASVRVKVGDRIRSGQIVARLGASGSVSSGPHLHFHVSDANSPLGAEGLPFVLRSFEALGLFESLAAFGSGASWVRAPAERLGARRMEMPLAQTVVRF